MNVPLKKRYNYCTINNGNMGSINVNAKSATINNATIYTEMLFKNRENNNENAEQALRIDIGSSGGGGGIAGGGGGGAAVTKLEPEKKINAAICTLSTAIMPSAVKGIQSMRVQQHYVQYAGDVVNPIQQSVPRCPSDENQVHTNHVAKVKQASPPPSAISSSSAVITSSASNHSFALSEQNDEKSSSQCSRKNACGATGVQKTDGSGSSTAVVRHTNKYLTENSIRLIELRCPGMTTHERVLNWKIADEFSDVEDDFDESRYTQSQPFRSERLQKRIYKKPVPATSSSASSSTASFAKPAFSTKSHEAPQKKYKPTMSKINEIARNFGSKSGSGSSSDVGERPLLQKMLAKKLWTKNTNHLRKRQLLPSKLQVSVPATAHVTVSTQPPLIIPEVPSAIKLRIDYTKKQTQSTAGNFKIPDVPSDKVGNDAQAAVRHKNVARSPAATTTNPNNTLNSIESTTESVTRLHDSGDDRASTTSSKSNEVAEISKARNTREEFYKYLGIDTNPCHEKLSPGSSTGDTNSSSQMRRSLRVKIQQNIVNKLAKPKFDVDKVKKEPSEKNDIDKTPASSNATESRSSDESKTNRTTPTTPTSHPPLKRTASPTIREESSKLLKISYIKDDGKKTSAEPIVYKSICLMNQTVDTAKTATKSMEKAAVSTPAHVFERRSYEIASPADNESMSSAKQTSCAYTVKVLASATDQRRSLDRFPQVATKETESMASSVKKEQIDDNDHEPTIELPADEQPVAVIASPQKSNSRPSDRAETKRRHLIRKAINFTEMFKRYKRCLRQGIALKSQMQQTIRRRPQRPQLAKLVVESRNSSEPTQPGPSTEITESADKVPAKMEHKIDHDDDDDNPDVANKLLNVIENNDDLPADVIATIIGLPSTSTIKPAAAAAAATVTSYEDFTFSPTSITHSNASTDSAIVVSNTGNDCVSTGPMLVNPVGKPTAATTSDAVASNECHIEQISSSTKPTIRNPLNPVNGCVQTILVHPITAHMQCVIVVQETAISFWRMASNVLNIFGVSPAWELIGEIKRLTNDTELVSLHQNRMIGGVGQYPVYVELRSRESPPNDARQSCLSFVYANIYALRRSANDEQLKLTVESVNLDSIKGYTSSINFIGIRNSSNVMMSWTEQTVQRTRSGLCKYNFKVPDYDSVESILDFAHLPHSIKSLTQLTGEENRDQVIGCGDRIVSVWDHQNGNLLMNFEIDLPSIGTNLGCFCFNYDSAEYMLLLQLHETDDNTKYQQLKLIAVHTTNSFSWRTLHSHNIPKRFGRIQSKHIGSDTLTITFINGNALLLNLFTPQIIYLRDETNVISTKNHASDSMPANCDDKVIDGSMQDTGKRAFVQADGQIVYVNNDHITTRSGWEYFVQKEQ